MDKIEMLKEIVEKKLQFDSQMIDEAYDNNYSRPTISYWETRRSAHEGLLEDIQAIKEA